MAPDEVPIWNPEPSLRLLRHAGLVPSEASNELDTGDRALWADETAYLVVDSLGARGSVYCETEIERPDLEIIISDLLEGQFSNPVRVIAFNTLEHWSKDVSGYVAEEIQILCDIEGRAVPDHIRDFLKSHTARANQLRGFDSALI